MRFIIQVPEYFLKIAPKPYSFFRTLRTSCKSPQNIQSRYPDIKLPIQLVILGTASAAMYLDTSDKLPTSFPSSLILFSRKIKKWVLEKSRLKDFTLHIFPMAPMLWFTVSPCTTVVKSNSPMAPWKRSFFSYQTEILLTLRSSDSSLNYYLWTENFFDNLGVSWGFSSLF